MIVRIKLSLWYISMLAEQVYCVCGEGIAYRSLLESVFMGNM